MPDRIDPALSLTLDVLRFSAAIIVLFGHASGIWLTGGYLWQFEQLMRAAVMIFFVLSGYVITATTSPADSGGDYAAARLSRLYSVALPALILTFAADTLGQHLNARFYLETAPRITHGHVNIVEAAGLRYLASLFFMNGLPIAPFREFPGTNVPYWSLAFEACYYTAFGVLVFIRSNALKAIAIAALFFFAGPSVVSLAPVWLLGALIWRLRRRVGVPMGLTLLCTGAAGLVIFAASKETRAVLDTGWPAWAGATIVSDYLVAIAVAAFILGASSVTWRFKEVPKGLTSAVRRIADHTFELYLVHLPIVYFAAATSPFKPASMAHVAYVYGTVALAVVITARISTPLRLGVRRWFERMLRGGVSLIASE